MGLSNYNFDKFSRVQCQEKYVTRAVRWQQSIRDLAQHHTIPLPHTWKIDLWPVRKLTILACNISIKRARTPWRLSCTTQHMRVAIKIPLGPDPLPIQECIGNRRQIGSRRRHLPGKSESLHRVKMDLDPLCTRLQSARISKHYMHSLELISDHKNEQ